MEGRGSEEYGSDSGSSGGRTARDEEMVRKMSGEAR
jgi:hypothetical protein